MTTVISRNRLKRMYRRGLFTYRRLSLLQAKFLCSNKFVSNRILIGYYPGNIVDGLGAQVQRIIALTGLSIYLNVGTSHMEIPRVALHPLDGLDEFQYEKMLQSLNKMFVSDSNIGDEDVITVNVNNLKFFDLLKSVILTIKKKKKILLCIRDPYFLVDANPAIYRLGISHKSLLALKTLAINDYSDAIVLHHRHGVGGMAIQPGQIAPRELELSRYSLPLRSALASTNINRIVIFTDAPESDFLFVPPHDQERLWEGLPKFEDGKMSIIGGRFDLLSRQFPQIREIKRGGNPLVSLAEMSTAGALVISRSSFGYLAALFANNSNVWIPSDFWHPKLPQWNEY